MLLLGAEHQDNWAQRMGFGGLGIVASILLIVVSCVMNWQFGYSLGRTEAAGHVYGAASVAADMFKVLSPFFIAAAWRAKSWNWAAACAAVWLITAAYGTLSAAGHAALNRADTSGARTIKANTYSDNSAALARAQEELKWIPSYRPANSVLTEMTAMKARPQWTWSSECVRPDGRDQAKLCQAYYKLKAELENAEKAEKLEAKIAELMAMRSGADASAVAGADPQANLLAKLTSLDLSTVNFALILMVILLLESGSGLGLFVSVKYLTGGQKGGPAFVDKSAAAPPAEEQAEVTITKLVATPVPAPKQLAAPLSRPEPSPKGRALLDRIGFPRVKPPGGPAEREGRDVLGLRWLAWLTAHQIAGEFPQEAVTRLYVAEYCDAQNIEPWGDKIAKGELMAIHKFKRQFAQSRQTRTGVVWTIQLPTYDEMNQMLDKAGFPAASKTRRTAVREPEKPAVQEPVAVVEPKKEEPVLETAPANGTHSPFSASSAAAPSTNGHKFFVDIPAMQTLAREEKVRWQARMLTPRRKSLNRFARARGNA